MNTKARTTSAALWAVWAALIVVGAVTIGWRIEPAWFLPSSFHAEQLGESIRALLGFFLLLPAIIGWGCLIGRGFGLLPDDSRAARALVILLLGQLTVSLFILAIGLLQLYPLGVWLVLFGAGGMVLEAPRWRLRSDQPLLPTGPARWWAIACAIVCAVAFIPGLAPVVESDGLRYHLFAPQEWLKAGGIIHLPYHAFSNLPLQHNMLYLAGLVFGNGSTAHLIHWLSLPTIMLATYCITAHLLHPSSFILHPFELPVLAALVVGTMPVILVLSGWPFIDLATLAYILGAIYATTLSNERKRYLLAGILCGAAIGTKLTALIPAFLLGVGMIPMFLSRGPNPQSPIPNPQSPHHFILHPLSFILPLLLIPSPWLIKSFLIHDNPVYPAAYNTFGGDEWAPETNDFYNDRAAQRGFGRSAIDFITSPIDITLRWSRMPGDVPSDFIRQEARERGMPSRLWMSNSPGFEEQNPGPAFLILLPLAFVAIIIAAKSLLGILPKRSSRHGQDARATFILTLQFLGGWAAWFFTYQSTRFALVPLVITIIMAMPIIARFTHDALTRNITRVIMGMCALTGFSWFAIYIFFVNPTAFVALGFIDRERLLEHRFNAWHAVQYLNETSRNEGVLYIGEHRGFHALYLVHLSDWFDKPLVLKHIQSTPDNATLIEQWRSSNIRYVLLNQAELSEYEDGLFRPRFTPAEWQRFTALRTHLLSTPDAIAFRDPDRPIYVIDLHSLPPF